MEVVASGSVTAPAAGAAICTLAAQPAGYYKVIVSSSVTGVATADVGNLRLRRAGVDLISPIPHGTNGDPRDFEMDEVQLNGAQNLTVEAIGVGTAGVEYNATILVRKK
jgi:hypothetical protein